MIRDNRILKQVREAREETAALARIQDEEELMEFLGIRDVEGMSQGQIDDLITNKRSFQNGNERIYFDT